MNPKRLRSRLLGSALACVLAFAACGGGSGEHPGKGVVREVDAGARTVTLQHEDIPGLMRAMTMTFQVAPGVELEGLDPGAEVAFEVGEKSGVYTVTSLRAGGS